MKQRNKIVLVTGGFDPIHSGHINLLKEASELGEKLIVGVNSDKWLIRKKGLNFLPIEERCLIIENLKMVSKVMTWNDNDDTANVLIYEIIKKLKSNEILLFANGGDRNKKSTPELIKYKNNSKIDFIFGVGGDYKMNSSSKILETYNKKKIK